MPFPSKSNMFTRFTSLALAGFALASCDVAKEQLDSQMRTAVAEQCAQVTQSIGIAGEFVTPVCECTADRFLDKSATELTQVDRARIEEIVRECLSETGAPDAGGPAGERNG